MHQHSLADMNTLYHTRTHVAPENHHPLPDHPPSSLRFPPSIPPAPSYLNTDTTTNSTANHPTVRTPRTQTDRRIRHALSHHHRSKALAAPTPHGRPAAMQSDHHPSVCSVLVLARPEVNLFQLLRTATAAAVQRQQQQQQLKQIVGRLEGRLWPECLVEI